MQRYTQSLASILAARTRLKHTREYRENIERLYLYFKTFGLGF
jgi:hypothetical protein